MALDDPHHSLALCCLCLAPGADLDETKMRFNPAGLYVAFVIRNFFLFLILSQVRGCPPNTCRPHKLLTRSDGRRPASDKLERACVDTKASLVAAHSLRLPTLVP